MVIACVLGVLGGIIGALPLLVVRRLVLKPGTIFQKQSIFFGLLGVVLSLALCLVAMLIYRQFDAEHFAGFGIFVIIAFLAATTISTVLGMRKLR